MLHWMVTRLLPSSDLIRTLAVVQFTPNIPLTIVKCHSPISFASYFTWVWFYIIPKLTIKWGEVTPSNNFNLALVSKQRWHQYLLYLGENKHFFYQLTRPYKRYDDVKEKSYNCVTNSRILKKYRCWMKLKYSASIIF